ncbi:MAG: hypothetical protein ACYSUM_03325 [Planctomycetota bacterium]|jgi:hypothetical protein
MVTASHNFRDQNGAKISRAPGELRLFPGQDRALTRRVLDLDHARDFAPRDATGECVDARDEASNVFDAFHLDERNSWMKEGQSFGDYWRMGFRLGSWIMLVAVPLLLVVWPS